jgi:hypothetical protein
LDNVWEIESNQENNMAKGRGTMVGHLNWNARNKKDVISGVSSKSVFLILLHTLFGSIYVMPRYQL